MNVLEVLQQYLLQQRPPNEDAPPDQAMIEMMRRRAALPPGLPDAVVDSIIGKPSRGEGDQAFAVNPWVEQERARVAGQPQRPDALLRALGLGQFMRQQNDPYPERGYAPAMPSEYASPLNSMMGRSSFPGALY